MVPLAEIQCFKCREMGHYANRCPVGSAHTQKSSKDREDTSGGNHVSGGSIFIEGSVGSFEMDLILDTGYTNTLVDSSVWRGMESRPDLHASSVDLWTANGDQLKVHGECTIPVEIAGMFCQARVLVGDAPGNAFIYGSVRNAPVRTLEIALVFSICLYRTDGQGFCGGLSPRSIVPGLWR